MPTAEKNVQYAKHDLHIRWFSQSKLFNGMTCLYVLDTPKLNYHNYLMMLVTYLHYHFYFQKHVI